MRAQFTLHVDLSTHGFDQRLGDREAQTTAIRVSIGLIAVIRRVNVLRFLFGIKPLPRLTQSAQAVTPLPQTSE